MGFYREHIKDYFLLGTPVENMFINEYMNSAPGDYVKVYLFALMYAGLGTDLTNADVARHLNMEPEDVLKAWTYWEKQNVIRNFAIVKADIPVIMPQGEHSLVLSALDDGVVIDEVFIRP